MSQSAYPAALAIGAVSGMRTMMAPSAINWMGRRAGLDLESNLEGWKTSAALAVGEMIADRLPFIANHTEGAEICSRALAGAAAGAAVSKAKNRSVAVGAALGAAAAIGMAFGAAFLRKKAARRFDVSERAISLAEDGIALGIGLLVVLNTRPLKPVPVETPLVD